MENDGGLGDVQGFPIILGMKRNPWMSEGRLFEVRGMEGRRGGTAPRSRESHGQEGFTSWGNLHCIEPEVEQYYGGNDGKPAR